MSHNNRVVWSEGMFLRPHHYQQYTRYIENLVDERARTTRSMCWGFTELVMDEKLLGLGKISISRARGIFPDGTPFFLPGDGDLPAALELGKDAAQSLIYMAIPLRKNGISELDHKHDPHSLARYAANEQEVEDNCTIGGSVATIQIASLRTRFLKHGDNRGDYACLAIARVRDQRSDGSLLLDEDYWPPVLDCQALPGMVATIRELHNLLLHRADALANRVLGAGGGGAAEIGDFLYLQVINRYLPVLAHLAGLQGLHPEELYRILIGMAGEIATFVAAEKKAPEFPPYQHDQLHATFDPVMESLRQSLSAVLEQSALPIPLQERKYGIRVATVNDRTLLDQARFVLAVTAEMPTDDVRKRIPLQLKIGPVEQIRQLVNVQLPGIRTRPLPVAPRQIPFHTGYVYFELEQTGELWEQLKKSGGFAFHLGGEFPGFKIEFWAVRGGHQ